MDVHEMLLTIIKVAEEHGQYDGYDQLELEYQNIVKKAKKFKEKIKKNI